MIFIFTATAETLLYVYIYIPLLGCGRIPKILSIFLMVIMVLATIVWLFCYMKTCWLDAGSIDHDLEKRGIDIEETQYPPAIDALPRCPKCNLPKPVRAHHCSTCKRCYFRFDHHCPIVGNCVALNNVKAFILFNFYNVIISIDASLALIFSLVYDTFNILRIVLFVIGIISGLYIAAISGTFGVDMLTKIVNNRTTLEQINCTPVRTYDVGIKENIRQIFGNSIILWIFPTSPPISGYYWSHIVDMNVVPDFLVNKESQESDEGTKSTDHDLVENKEQSTVEKGDERINDDKNEVIEP